MTKQSIGKKLYNAGLKVFQEKGYHNTDIRTVCKEAGVSLGSFYNYYKDKKSLYLIIFEDEYRRLTKQLIKSIKLILENDNDAKTNTKSIVQKHFENHEKTLLFYVETNVLKLQDDDILSLKSKLETEAIDTIKEVLKDLLSKEIDLKYGFPIIFGLVENSLRYILDKPKDVQEKTVIEISKIIFNYLFQ